MRACGNRCENLRIVRWSSKAKGAEWMQDVGSEDEGKRRMIVDDESVEEITFMSDLRHHLIYPHVTEAVRVIAGILPQSESWREAE